jgi:Tfp pilus assembly PilM family ATPase
VNVHRWLTPVPPSVAIAIASRRVTVVEVPWPGSTMSAYAGEGIPEGAVTPALTGVNIVAPDVVRAAIKRALDRAGLGSVRRAALVVPDTVARVSLLTFDQVPTRSQDLQQLIQWQLRKASPYPLEEAVISHFPAAAGEGHLSVAAVVGRRDVLAQYEGVVSELGIHAGVVDLASFNVINAVFASASPDGRDWLVIHMTPEATTLAILRGDSLMFYRHRAHADDEPLGSLVHQTAMYHEDRLGGGGFGRVWLSGAGPRPDEARVEISRRLNVPVESVDVRPAAGVDGLDAPSAEVLDALAAPVGILVRERRYAQG